jgi:hypothetical protein
MKITLEQGNAAAVGTAVVQTTQYAVIQQLLGPAPPDPRCFAYTTIVSEWNVPMTGTPGNLTFSGQRVSTQNGTSTNTLSFTGALANGVITGTTTYTEMTTGASPGSSSGSATFAVTLR